MTPTTEESESEKTNRTIPCRSTNLPPFQTLLYAQLPGSEKEENHNGMDKNQNRAGLQLRRHDAGLKRCRPSSPGPPRNRRRSGLRKGNQSNHQFREDEHDGTLERSLAGFTAIRWTNTLFLQRPRAVAANRPTANASATNRWGNSTSSSFCSAPSSAGPSSSPTKPNNSNNSDLEAATALNLGQED
ncbi:uncharacterized protein LOC120425640 [Culex pipiens pallens]|uniref:uncharacterized protein LOC120425640 n=1 Tax=Culex pipiens pallens TaxID=42434 RepID=UPI00195405CA|nr:uncharacterized protein LOC120425640 [Culex pipiens pallens]XP_052567623.1 uncharacterized protein LOC120425640 [Culex pipiens pallens]